MAERRTAREIDQGPAPSEGESNLSLLRRRWAAASAHAETDALLAADARHFLHQSVSTPCLSAVAKAEGIWIEDLAGRRFMDFHGNSAHHVGYRHPRLIAALKAQLDGLTFAPRRYTCETAVALAAKLAELAPGALSKALFATGGSDAIEIALKVARAATGRFKTVSFWDAFHGAGFGAASVGGEALFRSGPVGPLLAGTEHVPVYDCYRNPFGYSHTGREPHGAHCGKVCAALIRTALEKEGDVAAVVAEPMRAVPYLAPPGFWREVRQACDDHGALLIFDEIPTGLGKTGRLFACEHEGVAPDILVLGKALGGGVLPIAAALCRPELDVAGAWAFGHYTHEKNPVTARAALTTLAIIEDEGLVARADALGRHAVARLGEMMDRHRLVGDVRGRGLLMGVELVADRETRAPANQAAEEVFYRCLERGLSFKVSMGNVLTLSPPLIIDQGDLDRALDILDESLGEIRLA
jgi:4-aminobutyrate aminotransferase